MEAAGTKEGAAKAAGPKEGIWFWFRAAQVVALISNCTAASCACA